MDPRRMALVSVLARPYATRDRPRARIPRGPKAARCVRVAEHWARPLVEPSVSANIADHQNDVALRRMIDCEVHTSRRIDQATVTTFASGYEYRTRAAIPVLVSTSSLFAFWLSRVLRFPLLLLAPGLRMRLLRLLLSLRLLRMGLPQLLRL